MTRLSSLLLGLLLTLALCPSLTPAQQADNAKTEAAEAALREKAYATLQSLANQIGSLQSAENRARIGANIAEELWREDATRARALFQLVKEDIKLGLQPRRDHAYRNNIDVFLKLREDTVRRMAKLDAELALEFLRETFPIVKEELSFSDGQFRPEIAAREKALEVKLAREFARNNPESALKLAEKSLAQGLDYDLLMLLTRLSKNHQDDAHLLHKKIVSKIADTNLKDDEHALEFTRRLVLYFAPPAVDEGTFRELIEIVLKKANAAGCAGPQGPPSVCYTFGYMVPQIEKYFPTRLARLKRWVPSYYEADSSSNVHYQVEELIEGGSVEDIVALVARYPEHESTIYFHAIRQAEWTGDLERARKIAATYKGSNPELKRQLAEHVERYEISAAKTQSIMDQVQRDLEAMPMRQRIDLLLSLANHLAVEDPKNALKVLGQARELSENLKPSDHLLVQIAAAVLYCLAKSDQGFAIMEAMLPKLNELIAAGAKLDGFDTKYLRDGEWNMSAAGEVGNLLTFLSHNSGYFAWYDFDRAMNLTAQFERGEIRMMAQLKLAQGILAGPPKRVGGGAVFSH